MSQSMSFPGEVVGLQRLVDNPAQGAYRYLEDLTALHFGIGVAFGENAIAAGYPAVDVQQAFEFTIRMQVRRENAGFFDRLQNHRAGPVAE